MTKLGLGRTWRGKPTRAGAGLRTWMHARHTSLSKKATTGQKQRTKDIFSVTLHTLASQFLHRDEPRGLFFAGQANNSGMGCQLAPPSPVPTLPPSSMPPSALAIPLVFNLGRKSSAWLGHGA